MICTTHPATGKGNKAAKPSELAEVGKSESRSSTARVQRTQPIMKPTFRRRRAQPLFCGNSKPYTNKKRPSIIMSKSAPDHWPTSPKQYEVPLERNSSSTASNEQLGSNINSASSL